MRALAQTIMRGRIQAVMAVTVLAMLSMLLAPLSILSGAGVALVSLRLGAREGMLVILASWLACSLLSYLVFADALPATVFALALWVPVWALGLLLRTTRAMPLTIEVALLSGLLIIAGLYLVLPDPGKYLAEMMYEPVQQLIDEGKLEISGADSDKVLSGLSHWMTSVVATGYFLQMVAVMFVGRWWQAMIYNPGGFGDEFRDLRFHRPTAMIAAPLLLLVMFGEVPDWVVAVATLFLAAFFLQGLAVVHALLKKAKAGGFWIAGIYALLLLAMPYMMSVLALTGLTDTWMNFRKRAEKPDNEI
jgi:hypothetical protein